MNQDKPSLTLRRKKSLPFLFLIVCSLFVVIGVWMAQEHGWICYLFAGFFVIGIRIALFLLSQASNTCLRIAQDGLWVVDRHHETRIPWDDVDHFFSFSLELNGAARKMVGYRLLASYDRDHTGKRIGSGLASPESVLNDTYGKTAEELADILNRCLAEFSQGDDEQVGAREPD